MKQLHTVPSLFEALRGIIPNLPPSAITVDLHLDSREPFPLMRVEAEVLKDGAPVEVEGAFQVDARVYRVVEVATIATDLTATPGAEGEVGDDGMPVVYLHHNAQHARLSVPQPIADVLLAVFGEVAP